MCQCTRVALEVLWRAVDGNDLGLARDVAAVVEAEVTVGTNQYNDVSLLQGAAAVLADVERRVAAKQTTCHATQEGRNVEVVHSGHHVIQLQDKNIKKSPKCEGSQAR